MQRIRLAISLALLAATITLGLSWNTGGVEAEVVPECNCIDGFTHLDGVYSWDGERYSCVTGGCYVITE